MVWLHFLWWAVVALVAAPAHALKYIKTDNLLTCMENSEFTAELFQVYFYPHNNTAVFNIDGSSSIAGNIFADIEVVVYGINAIKKTFDFCSLNVKTICPLDSGRVQVEGTQEISSDITKDIPGVAYTIPDLDAYVQVAIYYNTDTERTNQLACLKATISNGKTVQTKYAGWPIAAISGFGLLVSSFVSIMGHSTTASHIASNAASLFIYFQNLAIMATMGVASIPPIGAAWAQNFMWTLGIIEAGFMQSIFFWYVQATGGEVTSTLDNRSVISISVQKFIKHLYKRALTVASASSDDIFSDSAIYTTDQYNLSGKTLVLRGMQRVAFLANIEISNLFLTSITFFFFIGFVFIILISVFRGICEILIKSGSINGGKFMAFRNKWNLVTKGALFRFIGITSPQIVLMCIWEFTQNNSNGCMAFAVVIFLVVMALMLYSIAMIMITGMNSIRKHANAARLLFGDEKILYKFGFLYSQYRASYYFWVSVSFAHLFIRSLLIAVLQQQGKVCACLIFAIEIIYAVATIWIRPYLDKRTNIYNIFIAIINVINSIFFMFYSNVFRQPPVVSSVAAVVYFVLNAVFALVLLIFTIVTCTIALLHKNPDSTYSQIKDDRNAFIPKEAGVDGHHEELELAALGATALQGQDRKSYIHAADEPILVDDSNSTFKTQQLDNSVINDNSRAELNPFASDVDSRRHSDDSISFGLPQQQQQQQHQHQRLGQGQQRQQQQPFGSSYGANPFGDTYR